MIARFDGLCFVDTNIWLYAFIADQDTNKHAIARQVIETESIIVSIQVLNEVTVNLLKKTDFGEDAIQGLLRSFYTRYPIIEFDEEILLDASQLRSRFSFSFWDSLIVASARYGGADFLLTEDMQNGLILDGSLRFINPFIGE